PVYKMDNYGVRAAAEAVTTEWALFAKLDTLPYRNGHNGWLEEAMQKVATDGHMGLTGGFCGHTPYRKLKPVGESYATSNKFSNNFTIMRISEWLEIEHRDVGPNFDGPVPLSMGDAVRRFADEVAIERVMEQSRRYLLVRLEDIDWSVFHVNQWGETLRRIRIKYLNREKVGPHLCSDTRYHWKVFDWQLYYEHPEPTLSERLYQYARYLYGRIRLSILWLRDRSTNR
ncbi:MAG TPA: hypothetical protein VJ952_04105, partial [Opitutales bacterium]|nr:hypothetical protein [Opitutales bacterium]